MSILRTIRDYAGSFAVAAVPAFAATAMMATCYSLAAGAATAIGMGSGLSVAAGIVGAGLTLGITIPIGIALGGGGLVLMSMLPGVGDAEPKPAGIAAGVVAGLAASVALAFNLTAADPATDPDATINNEPDVSVSQFEEASKTSPLQYAFESADGEMMVSVAANDDMQPIAVMPAKLAMA